MNADLTIQDRLKIQESIRTKYRKVAENPEGLFNYPTGRAGMKALEYAPEILQALSEDAVDSYCGVGDPFSLGPVTPGERVLDIGCGAGVDTMAAGVKVGSTGSATGVDLVPEMLIRAKENLKTTGLRNVSFQAASAERLPFRDDCFDVVISNGVFNLIADKKKALAEVFRVLRPGGALMMADQVLTGDLPGDKQSRLESWFR